MDDACRDIIEQLLTHLRSGFEATPTRNGCMVVAPFTRPDNEAIEIDVQALGDGNIRLSDSGESFDYLFVNGLEVFSSKSLAQHFSRITRRHKVDLVEGELSAIVPGDRSGEALARLLNAIQEMSYLVFRRAERAITTFSDEVEKVLISGSIPYDRDYHIQGATKDHTAAFHVARDSSEALVDPVSAATPSSAQLKAERLVFKWGDIKRLRPGVREFAVLDDRNDRLASVWTGTPLLVLQTYSDGFFFWSRDREIFLQKITETGPRPAASG